MPDEQEETFAHTVNEMEDAHEDCPQEGNKTYHNFLDGHLSEPTVLSANIPKGEHAQEIHDALDEIGKGRA